MNTRFAPIAGFCLIAVFASGCGLLKKKKTAETTSAVVSAAPAPPPPAPVATPAATPAAVVATDPPAPEDFEDEAFEKITADNFETELVKLEKEVE